MCTVSLVPLQNIRNGFVLTSNRDEAVGRDTLAPDFRMEAGRKLLFPKDKVAGGTWLGVSDRKRLVCLMNGAFEKHERGKSYRKSRGVVVKEFLTAENPSEFIESYDYRGIEPFTAIMVNWEVEIKFAEVVWDGTRLHFKDLPLEPHIWSSSPLYSTEMKQLRESWFSELEKKEGFSPETLLDFHHTGGIGDKEVDLIIDRGFLKTQSISQIIKSEDKLNFWYRDLPKNEVSQKSWEISEKEIS